MRVPPTSRLTTTLDDDLLSIRITLLGNPYVASVSSCDTTTPAGQKTEVQGLSSLAQRFIF